MSVINLKKNQGNLILWTMNLSFAGCGFLGIYHVGVAVCFKKYAPHLLLEKCGGASAGALSACCLLCDLPLGSMTSDFFRVVNEARRHSLGPFSPSFNIQTCLYEGLQKHLPNDAHKRVNGRLHISLTRVYDGKNVIVSDFNSREELLQALLCACFIPGFSGILPPRFRGVRYMDGAFSDNLPILDENTITVSPFCGESDICPRDQSSQLFHLNWANTSIEISRQNVNRFVRILFPPRAELLSKFCQQGFDDALQFLHRNNLISCRRCVAVQSTIVVPEIVSQHQEFDLDCRECRKYRKDALASNMPQTVLDVIQDYLEQANKGLTNWLFKHRGIKLLSLPATVPVDFFLATVSKISTLTPKLTEQIRRFLDDLINELNQTVQVRLWNKIFIRDPSHIEISGLLHSTHFYGPRVSILVDECTTPLEADVDNYEHVLKVTTNNDALYAYYYTDVQTNKVKITEIFDVTEDDDLSSDLKVYENPFDDHDNSNQHLHNTVLNEWNGAESEFFIDKQTTQPAIANNTKNISLQSRTYAPYGHLYHMEILDEQQLHQNDVERVKETNEGISQIAHNADGTQQSNISEIKKRLYWNRFEPQEKKAVDFDDTEIDQDQLHTQNLQLPPTLTYHVHSYHTVHMSSHSIPEQHTSLSLPSSTTSTGSAPSIPVSDYCINIE